MCLTFLALQGKCLEIFFFLENEIYFNYFKKKRIQIRPSEILAATLNLESDVRLIGGITAIYKFVRCNFTETDHYIIFDVHSEFLKFSTCHRFGRDIRIFDGASGGPATASP